LFISDGLLGKKPSLLMTSVVVLDSFGSMNQTSPDDGWKFERPTESKFAIQKVVRSSRSDAS